MTLEKLKGLKKAIEMCDGIIDCNNCEYTGYCKELTNEKYTEIFDLAIKQMEVEE